MDTNPLNAIRPGSVRGPYRRHSLAFKRAVVELALQPGASVARIAREHDLNTNRCSGGAALPEMACSVSRDPRPCCRWRSCLHRSPRRRMANRLRVRKRVTVCW
ncbi:MAG: transposase [Gammaproteobacteria bacterium]|nr:transposase [Gammaproteobacteria bacterium]